MLWPGYSPAYSHGLLLNTTSAMTICQAMHGVPLPPLPPAPALLTMCHSSSVETWSLPPRLSHSDGDVEEMDQKAYPYPRKSISDGEFTTVTKVSDPSKQCSATVQTQMDSDCSMHAFSPRSCPSPSADNQNEDEPAVVTKTDVTIQTDLPTSQSEALPLRAEADSNGEQECLTSPEPVISSSNEEPDPEAPPEEPAKPQEVDISGLELLYKSIEHMESIENSRLRHDAVEEPPPAPCPCPCPSPCPNAPLCSPNLAQSELRGLGLLCALAEQRFQEEIGKEEDDCTTAAEPEPAREPVAKPIRDLNRNYRTPKSEEDIKRFLASRQEAAQPTTHTINLTMAEDSVEAEVRRRMAELQRTYRETQRELHRLTPRKYSTDGENNGGKRAHSPSKRTPARNANARRKKHSGKKRASSHKPEVSSDPPPPVLERVTDVQEPAAPNKNKWSRMDAPPTLTPHKPPPCKLSLIKLPAVNNQKRRWSVDSPSARSSIESQIGDNSYSNGLWEDFVSQPSDVLNGNRKHKVADTSTSTHSSSKRRKVGRPKKHLDKAGSGPHSTETIVAKQHRNKASLVSFLLASKTAGAPGKIPPVEHRAKENLKSPSPSDAAAHSPEHRPKIRPKLKAEVKVKETWEEDDVLDWPLTKQPLPSDPLRPINQVFGSPLKFSANGHEKHSLKHDDDVDWIPPSKKPKCIVPPKHINIPHFNIQKSIEKINSSPKVKKPVAVPKDRRLSAEKQHLKKPVCSAVAEEVVPKLTSELQSFYLTPDQLTAESLPVRTLTAQGGLFYAGHVKALHPPDLYNIILDGDRPKSRPAVYSREEILRDSILEVRAPNVEALSVGTRICAYWSQQKRCLYPGTVASPSTPDPDLDEDFVTVEFDDGDSGRIRIQDIRLLPPDYPIVENDPNPLLSLTKRRRRNSSTSIDSKDRRASADSMLSSTSPSVTPTITTPSTELSQAEIDRELSAFFENAEVPSDAPKSPSSPTRPVVSPKVIENESKRLKKRRREKLMRLMTASAAASSVEVHKHKHKHRHHKHKHKHRHSSGSSSETTGKSDVELQPTTVQVKPESIEESKVDLPIKGDHLAHAEEVVKDDCFNKEIKDEENERKKVVEENAKKTVHDKGSTKKKIKEEENVNKKVKDAESDKKKMKDEDNKKKKVESEEVVKESKEILEENVEKVAQDVETKEEISRGKKPKKKQERQPSCETSKMAAFLPPRQLWNWLGKGHKRPGGKGRGKKEYYKCIQRGKETINVGDCAVFLSTNSPERPYIGRIESLWESWNGSMVVRVKWFYHPEETKGCPSSLKYPGGLFQSDHADDNDVQTISHRCEVLQMEEYEKRLQLHSGRTSQISDVYYLAGFYDPTNIQIRLEKGVVN